MRFMEIAEIVAKSSKCDISKVGAIIVKQGRIISAGYNGTVSGAHNQCEEVVEGKIVTNRNVVHAESNSIFFAAKVGISTDQCTMYTTLSPCFECAKAIIQSGIKFVYYKEAYRDISPIEYLKSNGVCVTMYEK